MIKCVVVHSGYAEDASMGVVTFVHPVGYKTPAEAVRSLADGIYHKIQEDDGRHNRSLNPCCLKASKDKGNVFCPKCSRRLEDDPFEFEEYVDRVHHLLNGTVDSFGCGTIWGLLPEDEAAEWHPWNSLKDLMTLKPKEIVEIDCNGEFVLTAMLSPGIIPIKDQEEFKDWIKHTYFENRKELGLPAYSSG